ncbi:MAG: nuclear transport factor 2 family protein [Kofleriaceae bacterium]|nr:nuclear transport factor 2 family protein [Kofleriaceae bacterium]
MRSLVIAAALVCALGACTKKQNAEVASPSARTPKEVVAAAKATIEQWRQAYEVRSVEALSKLYAHDVDLVVVHEGTPYLGWSSVESMLKDRVARTDSIRMRLKDMQVLSLAPDAASAVTTMTREQTEGATTVTENGTLTLVLRLEGGSWLITSEHYSYKRT